MIKLIRPEKPCELTEEVEKELVKEFKENGKAVWRKSYIVEPLLAMSHNKCCYCETKLEVQARPVSVEHFHYKDEYPDEVVLWENLLPSCSQCNSNKGTHDTIKEGPILNPTIDNPKDYLYLKAFMIKSKNNEFGSKGRLTVDLLDLNNRERLINPRIKIAVEIEKKMADIYEKMLYYVKRSDGKQYNKLRITRGVTDILKMAQPEAEYSAFMATIILDNDDYLATRDLMIEKGLWVEEMQRLHDMLYLISLDTGK